MKRAMEIVLPCLCFAFMGCTTVNNIFNSKPDPTTLHTFDNTTLTFPDDFPNDKPTILAFLTANDRSCDRLVRPLRALSTRGEVKLVGVMNYDTNEYLRDYPPAKDIVFPMMLDPKKKMAGRFNVGRYPTFIYLAVDGKELDRRYDVNKITEWYKQAWIDKGMRRMHKPNRAEADDE